MKGTNIEKIRKIEIDHLEEKYGRMVPDLKNYLSKESIMQVHLRNQTVGLLQRSLRDNNMNMTLFLNILINTEININKHL